MDSLQISVTDPAVSSEIDAWQDGARYTLNVIQTAPGVFDLESAMPAEEETAAPEAPMPGENKNPAIAMMMRGKPKK